MEGETCDHAPLMQSTPRRVLECIDGEYNENTRAHNEPEMGFAYYSCSQGPLSQG
jgi:hypothetical protein